MSKTNVPDDDIETRSQFEERLNSLIGSATANNVRVAGEYQAIVPGDRDFLLTITEQHHHDLTPINAPNRDRKPVNFDSIDVTSQASILQTLTGLELGSDTELVFCDDCERELHDGSIVNVHAELPMNGLRWIISRVYCRDCGPYALDDPRFGRTDVLVEAALGLASKGSRQRTAVIMTDVKLHDHSRPGDGVV